MASPGVFCYTPCQYCRLIAGEGKEPVRHSALAAAWHGPWHILTRRPLRTGGVQKPWGCGADSNSRGQETRKRHSSLALAGHGLEELMNIYFWSTDHIFWEATDMTYSTHWHLKHPLLPNTKRNKNKQKRKFSIKWWWYTTHRWIHKRIISGSYFFIYFTKKFF